MTHTDPGHDFPRWLAGVRADRRYDGQIAHVERLPERAARHADLEPPLSPLLTEALAAMAIERLYTHQAQAVAAARRG